MYLSSLVCKLSIHKFLDDWMYLSAERAWQVSFTGTMADATDLGHYSLQRACIVGDKVRLTTPPPPLLSRSLMWICKLRSSQRTVLNFICQKNLKAGFQVQVPSFKKNLKTSHHWNRKRIRRETLFVQRNKKWMCWISCCGFVFKKLNTVKGFLILKFYIVSLDFWITG